MTGRATTGQRLYPAKRIGGTALWKALGFKNARAFQRARAQETIAIRLYPDLTTGGVYALADDIARILADKESDP
jgi:hypothetical protein